MFATVVMITNATDRTQKIFSNFCNLNLLNVSAVFKAKIFKKKQAVPESLHSPRFSEETSMLGSSSSRGMTS